MSDAQNGEAHLLVPELKLLGLAVGGGGLRQAGGIIREFCLCGIPQKSQVFHRARRTSLMKIHALGPDVGKITQKRGRKQASCSHHQGKNASLPLLRMIRRHMWSELVKVRDVF